MGAGNEVIVPRDVLDGIMAVRDSGATNMLDVNTVIYYCKRMGFRTAAKWIKENRSQYVQGIFKGFNAQDNK